MTFAALRIFLKNSQRIVLPASRHILSASNHDKGEYASSKETHFGFETVSEDEKAKKVHDVFENVASQYDVMNDLMSGGIHHVWKDMFMSRLAPTPDTRLLDVAGGTGDIVFRFLRHANHARKGVSANDPADAATDYTNHGGEPRISVCDISQSMLDVGKQRAEALGYRDISWVCGNAQDLPFDADTFDCYTIAFGIRNVVDIDQALSEAYRVLRPGGRFMCLEFSHVRNSALRWVYDQYSFNVIPPLGQVIANDWKSYQYLVESIRKFPNQEIFKGMIEDAGFRNVTYENLTFGVTAIHSGFKI